MRVVPKLAKCCLCCSLKTGSFSIAFMLLVGSAVQTGYYGYLIKQMKPAQMCTDSYSTSRTMRVYDVLPNDEVIRFWSPFFGVSILEPPPEHRNRRSHPMAPDLHKAPADGLQNSADEEEETGPATVTTGRSTGERDYSDSSQLMTTTTTSTTTTTQPPKMESSAYSQRTTTLVRRKTWHTYLKNCRNPTRMPFNIDVNYLDFDLHVPFRKDTLYFNLAIFGTMMCFTPLLMYAVYKESQRLVLWWLMVETTLLAAAVAGTVAAAASLLKVLRVSVGIVTILNMAFHLAIDIYFLMVVFNYSEKLEMKDEEETEEIQV